MQISCLFLSCKELNCCLKNWVAF